MAMMGHTHVPSPRQPAHTHTHARSHACAYAHPLMATLGAVGRAPNSVCVCVWSWYAPTYP